MTEVILTNNHEPFVIYFAFAKKIVILLSSIDFYTHNQYITNIYVKGQPTIGLAYCLVCFAYSNVPHLCCYFADVFQQTKVAIAFEYNNGVRAYFLTVFHYLALAILL